MPDCGVCPLSPGPRTVCNINITAAIHPPPVALITIWIKYLCEQCGAIWREIFCSIIQLYYPLIAAPQLQSPRIFKYERAAKYAKNRYWKAEGFPKTQAQNQRWYIWSWYPPCCESPKQCLKNVCYCECKVLPMIMNLIVILKVVNVLLWTSWKSLLWKNHQSSVSVPARVRTLSWCSVPSETFGHSDKSHFIIFPFTVDSGGMVGVLGTLGRALEL